MFQVFLSVSYVCLQVFHMDVAYVCNGFQTFFRHFSNVSYAYFKCFICLLLYVTIVVSGRFKNRSCVIYGMCVRSHRRRGRCPRRLRTTTGVLSYESDALGACLLSV
jgi:hypothetical protein